MSLQRYGSSEKREFTPHDEGTYYALLIEANKDATKKWGKEEKPAVKFIFEYETKSGVSRKISKVVGKSLGCFEGKWSALANMISMFVDDLPEKLEAKEVEDDDVDRWIDEMVSQTFIIRIRNNKANDGRIFSNVVEVMLPPDAPKGQFKTSAEEANPLPDFDDDEIPF